MVEVPMEKLIEQGREAFAAGDTKTALECYRSLVAMDRRPEFCSALAYCLAREKGQYKEAVTLCNEAVRKDPKESRNFLLLGRIYLLAGRKKEAMRAFNLGLRHGASQEIRAELKKLGMRKQPPLPFLARENPLNIFFGKLLARWGIR
jgi:Flp pilus assembly protein TadD